MSGGFATVHPNNKLTINVIEAAPLEEFSPEVRRHIPSRMWRYARRLHGVAVPARQLPLAGRVSDVCPLDRGVLPLGVGHDVHVRIH